MVVEKAVVNFTMDEILTEGIDDWNNRGDFEPAPRARNCIYFAKLRRRFGSLQISRLPAGDVYRWSLRRRARLSRHIGKSCFAELETVGVHGVLDGHSMVMCVQIFDLHD